MDANFPYLPHLLKYDVIPKVNEVFSTRLDDPFNVYFDYGLIEDTTKQIMKLVYSGKVEDDLYPLIWLPFNIENQRGKRPDRYSETLFDLFIVMPTRTDYTMDEREQINLFPRLYPIYEEVLNQLSLSDKFDTSVEQEMIKHTEIFRPFWGGNITEGEAQKNLFENYVDALHIKGVQIKINTINECVVLTSF